MRVDLHFRLNDEHKILRGQYLTGDEYEFIKPNLDPVSGAVYEVEWSVLSTANGRPERTGASELWRTKTKISAPALSKEALLEAVRKQREPLLRVPAHTFHSQPLNHI